MHRSDRTDPADRPHDRRGQRRDVRGAAHQLAARARRLQTRTVKILARGNVRRVYHRCEWIMGEFISIRNFYTAKLGAYGSVLARGGRRQHPC